MSLMRFLGGFFNSRALSKQAEAMSRFERENQERVETIKQRIDSQSLQRRASVPRYTGPSPLAAQSSYSHSDTSSDWITPMAIGMALASSHNSSDSSSSCDSSSSFDSGGGDSGGGGASGDY